MTQGTVKWFNSEKDSASSKLKAETMYSFISQRSKAKVTKTLEEGQKVTFDVEQGQRGAQAANVVKA